MNTYVLRYENPFTKKRGKRARSQRFPASTDVEALNYAIDFCNKRRFDILYLWREEQRVQIFDTPDLVGNWTQNYTEFVDVYNPGSLDSN